MRSNDWTIKLSDAVHTARLLPFIWGVHDCVTFVAHCVDAMTGSDHVARMQRETAYHSEEEAYAVIASHGGWVGLISEFLGDHEETALYAAPGDVVLVINADREMLGIIIGHHVVAAAEEGLATLPYENIVTVWKV